MFTGDSSRVSHAYLWAKTRNLQSAIWFLFIAVVLPYAIPDHPGARSRSTIHDPKINNITMYFAYWVALINICFTWLEKLGNFGWSGNLSPCIKLLPCLYFYSSNMEGDAFFIRWPVNRIYYAAKVITVLDKHFIVRFSDDSVKKVRYTGCLRIFLAIIKINNIPCM